VAQKLSGLSATVGKETSRGDRSLLVWKIRLEGLAPSWPPRRYFLLSHDPAADYLADCAGADAGQLLIASDYRYN
jgi:hypothetical protein